jgi:hypothetical protein
MKNLEAVTNGELFFQPWALVAAVICFFALVAIAVYFTPEAKR